MIKLEFKMKKRKNIREMKLREFRNKNKMRKKEKLIGKEQRQPKKSRLKIQQNRMQKIQLEYKRTSCNNRKKFKKMLSYQ